MTRDEEALARHKKELAALEQDVLLEGSRQKYTWPISVEYLGQIVHLRLENGKRRILIDWVIPEELRGLDPRKRIKNQIPRQSGTPRKSDPGHCVDHAITWTRDMIKREVAVRLNGGSNSTQEPRDLRVAELFRRFRESEARRHRPQFDGRG